MKTEKVNIEKIVNHWITSSDRDFKTMMNLYKSKDYHWTLFIGHLVIERLLKAGVVRNIKAHAPLTHDLRRLSKISNIEFEDEHIIWFDTITTFNLNARYDSYKHDFYKKCTPEFTETWVSRIKQLREWIKCRL